MKRVTVTIAIFVMLAVSAAHGQVNDAGTSYSHARFVSGKRALENLVDFPDVEIDGALTVTCSGRASAKGRLKDARCSSPQDPNLDFTLAVSRRFNATRLDPATVNGHTEEVDFQFTVIFERDEELEKITVYPNNQKNVDRLGLTYVSAQRYSPHQFPNRCRGWRQDDLILEVAIVEATGNPRDVDVMSTVGIPSRCRDAFLTQLKNGRWIPAMLDGKYVESVWVSPIVLSNVSYRRQQSRE